MFVYRLIRHLHPYAKYFTDEMLADDVYNRMHAVVAERVFDHYLTPEEERKLYDEWHFRFHSPRFEIPTPKAPPGTVRYDANGRIVTV